MDSSDLGWRALARRQWPLAGALAFLLALETFGDAPWWQFPGTAAVSVLAIVAPRRPFDACLAAATALLASSVVLRLADTPSSVPFTGGLVVSEGAASMALIAIAVRQASPARAVLGPLVLVAAAFVTQWIRPPYWERYAAKYDFAGPDVLQEVVALTIVLVLAVGTGLYFRARDRERSTAVRAEVAAAQHAERMALARELHDVVAHYVTGIVVHAQAAQAVPGAAQEVLPVIVSSGNEALTAMRRLVGTLRGNEADAPAASNDLARDVRAVVEESGQPVRLRVDLPSDVPTSLERSVLRLVQESLTNSRKHAEGVSLVDVSVTVVDDAVVVLVTDDGREGRSAPVGGSGGFGLIGMRERVELLGGRFTAGRIASGGWQVRAELPIA
ncbi:histidine kinase [Actinosynnema sp. NPDC020468]|uniref:sensor histidine kinase n=1 Tax=Actinosynnema sp. NPDC020468 TaxID=3154488 RepID=UPI00340458DE